MSRLIVDSRAGVLAQGAAFLRAKAVGRVEAEKARQPGLIRAVI